MQMQFFFFFFNEVRILTLNMVSGRPHIPKRSAELTVAAVGGNLDFNNAKPLIRTLALHYIAQKENKT
jgi:hypothetical protein